VDAGWQINHLDLAPRYAGVLVGITMTAGMLAGVINPLVIAALVKHQVRQCHVVQWRNQKLCVLGRPGRRRREGRVGGVWGAD